MTGPTAPRVRAAFGLAVPASAPARAEDHGLPVAAADKDRVIAELTDRTNGMRPSWLGRSSSGSDRQARILGDAARTGPSRGAAPEDREGTRWSDDMVVRQRGWTDDAR